MKIVPGGGSGMTVAWAGMCLIFGAFVSAGFHFEQGIEGLSYWALFLSVLRVNVIAACSAFLSGWAFLGFLYLVFGLCHLWHGDDDGEIPISELT